MIFAAETVTSLIIKVELQYFFFLKNREKAQWVKFLHWRGAWQKNKKKGKKRCLKICKCIQFNQFQFGVSKSSRHAWGLQPSLPQRAATQATFTSSAGALKKPCQPRSSDPGSRFVRETLKQSFKAGWVWRWQWLHYVSDNYFGFCFVCCKAREKGSFHVW